MQDTIKPDDARALLQSAQQLRTHWSGVIVTHIGYAIMINVAIWSYFLKSYFDSLAVPGKAQPSYIVIAAALSAILLGLWRLYTRYIDNHIAGLYPDFLLYEGTLSVPSDHGTSGYLIRAIPRVKPILELTPEQKLKGIKILVESKRIGRRGHLAIDVCVFFILLGMSAVSFLLRDELQCSVAIACFIGIGIGFLCFVIGFFRYQRNPSKGFIEKIQAKLKKNGGSGA